MQNLRSMKYKALVIDDENKTRTLLKKMIEDLNYEIEISEASDLKSGLKGIQETKPNIVLLDIQMPDGTGFDLLDLTRDRSFSLIFITAHEYFAIRALKAEATDYLLKPIDFEELKNAIEKAIKKQSGDKSGDLELSGDNSDKLILKTTESVYLVRLKEIVRCESSRNYTQFYLSDGRKIMTSKTLKDYVILEENPSFFRCHRSHIINLAFLDRYDRANGGFVLMKNGSEVPVSRANKEVFFNRLENL